jgi:hypothetical protein
MSLVEKAAEQLVSSGSDGNRTAGLAPRALDRYEFSVRNGRLSLGRLHRVSRVDGTRARAQIYGFAPRGGGEPVTGPESRLYRPAKAS